MNKQATHFYLVPVTRGKDEEILEQFLRERNYLFCLPAALHGDVLTEYNKFKKPLGIIIKEAMLEESDYE
jgi:hypothetical protein